MPLSNNSIPGEYRTSLEGHKAFCPNSLPPNNLTLSPTTIRLVEEATHRLGQVEMCKTLLPNANLLTYSSLRREALASSTIEGTIASPEELVLLQASHQHPSDATVEVANYIAALEWGCDAIKERPIATNMMLQLNGILLDGVRGQAGAGQLKSRQNFIGRGRNSGSGGSLFIPASPDAVRQFLSDLERYINLDNREPRVVQCALAHYQFETIHPFADGNGRVGRLLIILHMIQLELLSAPLIYPSVFFERSRDQYIFHLQNIRDNDDWEGWIEYFTRGVIQQCQETVEFTQGLGMLRLKLQSQIQDIRKRVSLVGFAQIIKFFFEISSVRMVSDRTDLINCAA